MTAETRRGLEAGEVPLGALVIKTSELTWPGAQPPDTPQAVFAATLPPSNRPFAENPSPLNENEANGGTNTSGFTVHEPEVIVFTPRPMVRLASSMTT